jgi:hypothetical protein
VVGQIVGGEATEKQKFGFFAVSELYLLINAYK